MLYSLLSLLIVFCIIISCKKNSNPSGSPTSKPSTPPVGSCTITLADAENVQIFPADNVWNKDISSSAVDQNSTQIINLMQNFFIKADFGQGLWDGKPIGIAYAVVCEQTMNPVTFRANSYDGNFGTQSDAGPYNIPLNAPIEGNGIGEGDAHVIVVDNNKQILYELYNASVNNGHWEASCGAIFDLKSNAMRPDGRTSADGAGLPIFPGLVRYEEILKGVIDHPIRFTLEKSNVQPAYIAPATHKVDGQAGVTTGLPFGASIRLKQGYDISKFSTTNQIILKAMKKYGLILADIGSNLFISGAPDERWVNDDLQNLKTVKGSDFEVVKIQ